MINNSEQEDLNRNDSQDLDNMPSLGLSKKPSKIVFNGFSLRIEDLVVWVPYSKSCGKETMEKDILKGISSTIEPGKMTAIIGPSGSGKTTLMNYLSGRQNESQAFKTYCHYFLNNSRIKNVNDFKNIIGYVLQDDIMETSLTPRQLFTYYATMRGLKNIKERVDDVINVMGLDKCCDTRVGDVFKRGISGGERKRTSIGIELVSDPNLLFLDEPTTGLDSTTALDVMKNLADLKERGITIISTIHAPSKEILDLFDKLIILVDGKLAYDGSPQDLTGRIEELEFELPDHLEPIEYFMKVIDKDDLKIQFEKEGKDKGENDSILKEEYEQRIDTLVENQATKTVAVMKDTRPEETDIAELYKLSKEKNRKLNVFSQFFILLKMNLYVFFKDFFGIVVKSLMFWVISALLIAVYYDLGKPGENPIVAIQNRAGFIFIVSINYFFTGSNLTSTLFIPRKQIFLKDKQNRLYDDGPFYLATQLYILPLYLVNIVISVVAIYFATQLNNDPHTNLGWYLLLSYLGAFIGGGSIGLLLGILADKLEDVGALFPVFILPQFIVAGFFANVKNMTWPLYLLSFISPIRFTFQGMILTEFQNRDEYINGCKCWLISTGSRKGEM